MTLTAGLTQIVEDALDGLDRLGHEDRRVVEYCIDQMIEGGSDAYHGGERPERKDGDKYFLAKIIRDKFRRRGIELSNHEEATS